MACTKCNGSGLFNFPILNENYSVEISGTSFPNIDDDVPMYEKKTITCPFCKQDWYDSFECVGQNIHGHWVYKAGPNYICLRHPVLSQNHNPFDKDYSVLFIERVIGKDLFLLRTNGPSVLMEGKCLRQFNIQDESLQLKYKDALEKIERLKSDVSFWKIVNAKPVREVVTKRTGLLKLFRRIFSFRKMFKKYHYKRNDIRLQKSTGEIIDRIADRMEKETTISVGEGNMILFIAQEEINR